VNLRLAVRPHRRKNDGADVRPSEQAGEVEPRQLELEAFSDDDTGLTLSAPATLQTWSRQRKSWSRKQIAVFVVMPLVVMIAAGAVGHLRWQHAALSAADAARVNSVRAATDATVAILSYRPDTVEMDLAAAEDLLTGAFRDSYVSLTKDVVIPGAKQKRVSAEASVPAASWVSATDDRAVVLVFVNQALVIGNDAPSSTTSSVRVTLDKIDDRWLVSGFDPV
jgi:Mce-associated membrane protein